RCGKVDRGIVFENAQMQGCAACAGKLHGPFDCRRQYRLGRYDGQNRCISLHADRLDCRGLIRCFLQPDSIDLAQSIPASGAQREPASAAFHARGESRRLAASRPHNKAAQTPMLSSRSSQWSMPKPNRCLRYGTYNTADSRAVRPARPRQSAALGRRTASARELLKLRLTKISATFARTSDMKVMALASACGMPVARKAAWKPMIRIS